MKTEETRKSTIPQTLTHTWSVEMHPRNLPPTKDRTVTVEVQATSKQEAINKAISEKPGHTWGEVRQLADPPHILVQGGVPAKAAHEGSAIHEIREQYDAAVRQSVKDVVEGYAERVRVPQPPVPDTFKSEDLWAEAWQPTRREGEELSINQIVQEAIGTGSMCWRTTPTGVFDSERAAWVAGGAINAIEKVIFWKQQNEQARADEHAEMVKRKTMEEAEHAAREMDVCAGPGMATQSEEDRLAWIQRNADKAAVVDLILSYRNVADDATKMRQIKVVMD